ncbi:Imm32 family immunity protein [Pseudomonas weihenstephanensis]|uniref:Imm32 family immunity protein n=1 Tax=Pseudomonas weihenstephanensis TaxID=1608994 RepID=UPI00069FF7FB|nr:hypothetical protein [Pseudomonas weihenstephanensis]
MRDIGRFEINGTAAGKDNSIKLDEISILACPETIRAIGEFLIKAADRMKFDGSDHMHLQDNFNGFSELMHVDVIVLNDEITHKV